MRALLRALMTGFGFAEDCVEGVVLAADEALMNAFEHAHHGNSSEEVIGLNVRLYPERLLLEILDRGPSAPSADAILPEMDSDRGRGLFLIHQVMDEVQLLPREGGGTRVLLVKNR